MNNRNLTTHQQEIFNDIVNDLTKNMQHFSMNDDAQRHLRSLTGSAGTGKSFLTVQIVSHMVDFIRNLPYSHKNIAITAPTHKAVGILREELKQNGIQVHCSTLHSFLKVKLKRDYNTGAEKFVADKFDPSQNEASILVVDESSMISSELYDLIVEAIETRKIQEVLFIGDPYQLLSIGDRENKVYQLEKQYKLTQIVRQKKDNDIISLSQKLKNRIQDQNFIPLDEIFKEITNSKDIEIFSDRDAFVEDFYKNKDWHTEDKIFTSYTNATVDSLNDIIRTQYWKEQGIVEPEYLMKGDTIRFKSSLNADGVESVITNGVFRNDEEVKLDSAKLIVDTKLGIKYWKCSVEDRRSDVFHVLDPNSLIAFNKILQNIAVDARHAKFHYIRKYWRKYYGLKYSFGHVGYSFSATIHKLQGSTYDSAYIDLNSLMYDTRMDEDMKYRLVYVAITRARHSIKVFY